MIVKLALWYLDWFADNAVSARWGGGDDTGRGRSEAAEGGCRNKDHTSPGKLLEAGLGVSQSCRRGRISAVNG